MTTALYRRYRPDTFTDVIGQEHVTEPLMQALRADKVTHAYLFSGPRGCGKTTSARILARCLNCAQGPTAEPCGVCDSCRELGLGGAGSLDVVEIDAASHGGVDDARDLRERATFAPTRDRFKIFILDEAHMVSSQGFNALLKIVEEPPPHVKFIFATTEPDKVIGTIRSRTHHYPFRLVGPSTLQPYLEQICAAEGVAVGAGVLPLVVRAGGGSVRDSLSVLDQLVAGAGAHGIDYERAVALLGYTHAALLDDVVDAVAARDGASAFRVVDRVVSSGHEPRRFVEDLLERLRDLIVIAASGEAAQAVLRDLPSDQLDRMRGQATVLGAAELSRSADLVNTALTEMTGATSPRLHLELLVARLLLPAADDGAHGLGARLDRVERQLAGGSAPARPAVPAAAAEPPRDELTSSRPAAPAVQPVVPTPPPDPPSTSSAGRAEPAAEAGRGRDRGGFDEPVRETEPAPAPISGTAPPALRAPGAEDAGADAEMVRRRWPEVLQTLRGLRMATWVLVSQNAHVGEVTAEALTLSFTTPQLATTFRSGPHPDNVRRALHETLGLDVRVDSGLATGAQEAAAAGAPTDGPGRGAGNVTTADAEASWTAAPVGGAAAPVSAEVPTRPAAAGPADAAPASEPPPPWDVEPPADESAPPDDRYAPRSGSAAAPPAQAAAGSSPPRLRVKEGQRPRSGGPAPTRRQDVDDTDPDDPDLTSSGLVGAPLVAQMLGGTVIDEIPEDGT